MKNRKVLLILGVVVLGVSAVIYGCKEETYNYERNPIAGVPHDPSKPVEITSFIPAEGRIREKVVINGSNFGTDLSKLKVYFDDGYTDNEATIMNADGNNIYCLAPKQSDGRSTIKVVVDEGTPVTSKEYFHYRAAAFVSWVAGAGKRDGAGAKYEDGTLSESHFWKPQGIVALGDNQIMTFGFHEGMANKVRLISVNDDKVITLQTAFIWVSLLSMKIEPGYMLLL